MDFLANLAKSGGDSKKPAGEEDSSTTSHHDFLTNAKVVSEAAKAQYSGQPESYDKRKAAGAAAELIDDAEKYGKLDETKGVGKYVEQAEDYLRNYGGPKPTTHTDTATPHASGEDKPAPTTTTTAHAAGEKKDESEGGYGDMLKAAGGFFNK